MAFKIGKDVKIHETARIEVEEGFIGDRAIIRDHVVIEGYHIEIGHEAYFDSYAHIGGGSCFDPQAKLIVGDWLHMGENSHINFAEPVTIGHEFGCGRGTQVFAHGAYLSALDGFPVKWAGVTIGNQVWMPRAWVNPGVTVGSNVVVAAMSLVNKDLPSGCLAGGIPVRVIAENVYPRKLPQDKGMEILRDILCRALEIDAAKYPGRTHRVSIGHGFGPISDDGDAPLTGIVIEFDGTVFNVDGRTITGPCDESTEIVKNQLRRNGIRFRYYADEGEYKPWGK